MFRLAYQRLLPLTNVCIRNNSNGKCRVDVDKCAERICQLVDQAAEHMTEASRKIREFDTKLHRADLVTATDRDIERLLIEGLQTHFPNHVYIGEEGTTSASTGHKLTDEPTWIIDPIDGTLNFVHGFQYSCISVGFWLNKQPELAIVHNPMLGLLFAARRNRGAYLNGSPIQVSGQSELDRSLVVLEVTPVSCQPEHKDIMWKNILQLGQQSQALRSTGSSVMNMCLVAMGAADAYYEFFNHSWDMAAGALLVREAGGVVIDPAGGEFDLMSRRVVAAATNQLGCQVAQLLGNSQIYPQRDDERHN